MEANKNPDTKIVPPAEQAKPVLHPGDVTFRSLERKENVFVITFGWADMLGGIHEHTFNRGDIFADFNSVIKVFTDGGLPIDPEKIPEFKTRLCQLSTVLIKQPEQAAPAADAQKLSK